MFRVKVSFQYKTQFALLRFFFAFDHVIHLYIKDITRKQQRNGVGPDQRLLANEITVNQPASDTYVHHQKHSQRNSFGFFGSKDLVGLRQIGQGRKRGTQGAHDCCVCHRVCILEVYESIDIWLKLRFNFMLKKYAISFITFHWILLFVNTLACPFIVLFPI